MKKSLNATEEKESNPHNYPPVTNPNHCATAASCQLTEFWTLLNETKYKHQAILIF